MAGPFVGVHNDALIVAGGANFPGRKPWDGGQKEWHDEIYVLHKSAAGNYEWVRKIFHLERPIAYGVSVSTIDGVLCIGGCDADKSYRDVFVLKWNSERQIIEQKRMPYLPLPMSKMGGAAIGNKVYVVCGEVGGKASKVLFSLDLDSKKPAWEKETEFPGDARLMPTVSAQSNGKKECLFVVSGKTPGPLHAIKFFSDAWMYSPSTGKWKKRKDIINGMPAVAAASAPVGDDRIFIFGGGGSERCSVGERIENGKKIQSATTQAEKDSLTNFNWKLMAEDSGHRQETLIYNTRNDSWTIGAKMPKGSSVVTVQAVKWGDMIVIPSGETRPGVRTARVTVLKVGARE